MEIIKNFFPTPDWFASLPATEIDSSFIKEMIWLHSILDFLSIFKIHICVSAFISLSGLSIYLVISICHCLILSILNKTLLLGLPVTEIDSSFIKEMIWMPSILDVLSIFKIWYLFFCLYISFRTFNIFSHIYLPLPYFRY